MFHTEIKRVNFQVPVRTSCVLNNRVADCGAVWKANGLSVFGWTESKKPRASHGRAFAKNALLHALSDAMNVG
jgi:hypothetical protein